ncbi:hypothetical protein G7Y89_g11729 [Cudoniella acicularis]|uniref:F-box domain-containing protein n=1 Tax=Cudoniella acicularis TaxID=354080 RepID=A0A8H4RAC5_9HELO|nr:hypothetical protein G7Y89_g11729 [Cudoniella acicularis]
MRTLADLPSEVITLVAIELETEDFLNLRHTCRDLNSKSFSQFLGCYFKVRYHMLNRHSLQNLLEVSAHPVFGPSLHTLEICVDHLTEDPPDYEPGTWIEPGRWMFLAESDTAANVNEEAYKYCLEDQKRLGECGLDTTYLTRALINLSKCRAVYINDTHRPWGAASQKRQTGVRPTSSMGRVESIDYIKRTLKVVLAAIMASQVSLDLFEISPGFNRQAISPEMLPLWQDFHLRQPILQLTPFTSLSLMINPEPHTHSEAWAQDLLTFIGLFPALKELSLHFHPGDNHGRLGTLSTSLRLHCLRVLSITATECAEDDLATLFLNHKDTLREIYLDCVDIIEEKGSWTSLELMVEEQLSVENFSRPDFSWR